MSSVKEEFNKIASAPDSYWLLEGRRARFKSAPFRTLKNAAIRRGLQGAINVGVVKKAVKVRTFWGEKILIPSRSAFNVWEKGFLEGEDYRLTGFIVNVLREGDVFIDGGASLGWYTLIASGLVGEQGRVYSFEPTDRSFAILQANTATHSNVTINHMALWKECGTVQFNDFGFKFDVANTIIQEKGRIDYYDKLVIHNAEHRVVSVSAITLDNYCHEKNIEPDFIKLDCEGAEFEILFAATATLKKHPIIATEILGSTLRFGIGKNLVELLRSSGYKPYLIKNDFTITPLESQPAFELANAIFVHNSRRLKEVGPGRFQAWE